VCVVWCNALVASGGNAGAYEHTVCSAIMPQGKECCIKASARSRQQEKLLARQMMQIACAQPRQLPLAPSECILKAINITSNKPTNAHKQHREQTTLWSKQSQTQEASRLRLTAAWKALKPSNTFVSHSQRTVARPCSRTSRRSCSAGCPVAAPWRSNVEYAHPTLTPASVSR